MWNYNFILPNSCILLTLLVFYFSKPRLALRLNKSFLHVLVIELLVMGSDVIASVCLERPQQYPQFFLRFTNVLYFVLFALRSFFFFILTQDMLGLRSGRKIICQLLQASVLIVVGAVMILNLRFDLLFSIDASGYHRAPWYNIIYVCAFFYIGIALINVARSCRRVAKEHFWTALPLNLVLLFGYLMRIYFPRYLLMDGFCILAIVICYFTFENPLRYLERRTGLFNARALREMLAEIEGEKAPLILGFTLHNYQELREMYSSSQMDEGLSLIGQYLLKKFRNYTAFYIGIGMFVLIGADNNQTDSIHTLIADRFKKPWNADDDVDIMLEIGFAKVKPNLVIENSELLFKGFVSALSKVEIVENELVTVTEESISIIERNTEIKRAVEYAIEKNAVELYLQPLVDTDTYKLVGAEALARIRDAAGTIVPPSLFIPIAERNGRINKLGEQMFEKACSFIKEHDIEAMGISWINVNLSPIQFLRRDLNDRFSAILKQYDVPAEKIHLEITEAAIIDYAVLQKQIKRMKKTGFQFVLDDYGSGYSNVSRLKRCPFTNVKLDMEIVWDYFKSRDQILPTLVQTFKQMHFTVTAEGIETKEMADEMKSIGCDFLQGFCFDKPLPAAKFVKKYGVN